MLPGTNIPKQWETKMVFAFSQAKAITLFECFLALGIGRALVAEQHSGITFSLHADIAYACLNMIDLKLRQGKSVLMKEIILCFSDM